MDGSVGPWRLLDRRAVTHPTTFEAKSPVPVEVVSGLTFGTLFRELLVAQGVE